MLDAATLFEVMAESTESEDGNHKSKSAADSSKVPPQVASRGRVRCFATISITLYQRAGVTGPLVTKSASTDGTDSNGWRGFSFRSSFRKRSFRKGLQVAQGSFRASYGIR